MEFSIIKESNCCSYPNSPFNPPSLYPEYFIDRGTNPKNYLYPMIRNLLSNLKLDRKNFNTKYWNPFKDLIKKNDTVVIKPNFVKHIHPLGNNSILSTITNGAVIRPLIDYVHIALGNTGKIIICDTPIETADFNMIVKINGVNKMVDYLRSNGIDNLELFDYI